MTVKSTTSVNVKQAVPFFGVTNMEASLRLWVPKTPSDLKINKIQGAP